MAKPAPLMLSISGLRGLVGQSLTPAVAADYAAAFGSWLRETSDAPGAPRVVLGRDSRPSGAMLELAATSGLLSVGCEVVRLGILSTPGVAVMIKQLDAQGAMVITASHNPLPWNGLKALRQDGVAPPPEQAQQIIDRYRAKQLDYVAVEDLPAARTDDSGAVVHVEKVLEQVDVALIRGAKLAAVVDATHGAGGPEAELLLEKLGVKCVGMYLEPTGLFPHTPEPTRENLTELAGKVAEAGADIGFAQDPDADRLAVVDEQGAYIGEEYTLALCAMHRLGQGGAVAANLSTSRMVDDIAKAVGGKVLRTPVGEANVAKAMREHDAEIGGEGNGGIILRSISQVRDSLVGMALLLEMLAKRKQPLSKLVASTPAYAIVKDKVALPDPPPDLVAGMQAGYAGEQIDLQDGVRVDWADRWVHVRPSNTEPILRVIAEAADEATARGLVEDVKAKLGL